MGDYPITESQVSFYRENGFIQLDNVLAADELASIREGVEQVWAEQRRLAAVPEPPDSEYARVFVQMVNIWRVNPLVRDYVLSPRIGRIARALCGAAKVRLWHDHALIKEPHRSRPSAWHQDLPYWPHHQSGSLSCWMALDDVSPANGCMSFVPRSHTWGRFKPVRLGDPQDLFSLVPDPHLKDFTPVPMPMTAGSCTFHDSLMFHYAGPNTADHPRRAMVTIYMPDGTTYDGRPHVVTDPLPLSAGDVLTGDMFPLVG